MIVKIGIGKFKTGDLYGAERVFRDIIDTPSEHPDAYHNLGVVLVKTDRMEQSVPYFEKALSIDGESAVLDFICRCSYFLEKY